MHILFDPQSVVLDHFIQTGSGMEYFQGLPYYRGRGYSLQKGSGVGGILRSLWRYVYPILKSEGVQTGKRIIQDIATGPMNRGSVKEAVVSEGVEGLKNVLDSVREKWNQQRKSQRGSGKMRRRKTPLIVTNSDIIEPSVPLKKLLNKKRIDNLGSY